MARRLAQGPSVFEKRQTIVNPAKLTLGVAAQICGSCHDRGTATKVKDAAWPVGYAPGRALEPYYRSKVFPEGGDVKVFLGCFLVGSSRVDLQACKLEYSIVSPK